MEVQQCLENDSHETCLVKAEIPEPLPNSATYENVIQERLFVPVRKDVAHCIE
jgi:hypothetical protein